VFRQRIAVNIAFFINGFVYANWVSRLPRIQELYGANDQTIAFVLLALSTGAVVAMPFAGWIIIRNGSRRITLLSVILYCVFVPVIPLFEFWGYAIPLFFIMGAVTGVLDVAMNAQAVIVEQRYAKPIMTSFHAYFSIGMALGAWCGALFAETGSQLIVHFGIIVIAALLISAWMFFHLIHDMPSRETVHEGPLFRLPNAALITVGVVAFCCMMGEGSMADWSVNYMENIAGAGKSLAPLALSAFATAMTVGRIFGDRVRASVGDVRLIVVGGVIATGGLALALIFPIPYVVITGCFFVGLGLSTIVPITYSIAGNTKDLPAGVGLAMVTTVGYTGFLFGPPIIGFIAEWQNLRIALLFVAVLLLVMTILGAAYRRK
jgi:MFS family permease